MYTLISLITIWFIYSIYDVRKNSIKYNEVFNPGYATNVVTFVGFAMVLGIIILVFVVILVYLTTTYLP